MRISGSFRRSAIADRPGAVDAGGLLELGRDRVQRAVHDDDPAAGAGPERDHREDVGQVSGGDRLGEDVRPEHVVQQERAGADGRVEHEEPDQDGRRAGQRARDVEEEAVGRRDPARAAVQEEREADDEDDEQAEPDARVDEDVLERRAEAVVVVRPHEVVEADPAAVDVGEGEVERVDRRRDAEEDQERQVRQDERQAAEAAGATLARGPRVPARSGQTRSSHRAVIA